MSSIDRTEAGQVTTEYPESRETGRAQPAGEDPGASGGSLARALRVLRPVLGAAGTATGQPLEAQSLRADPPQVADVRLLEPAGPRQVSPAPRAPLVAAFLDGIQRSRVLAHVQATPVIHATTAAVIRERRDRTLGTWGAPLVVRQLLASRRALGDEIWQALTHAGLSPVDLTAPEVGADSVQEAVHPWSLRARALERVAQERERLERQLAAAWVEREARWLWMDGGLAGNVSLTPATPVVGVVKSHTTLYGSGPLVRDVLALREGMRSPAFLVGHRLRQAVASWYLRLRAPEAHGGDPLFGLIRVEVAPPTEALDPASWHDDGRARFSAHCDTVSAGLLLERSPLALPDPRWDTLAYGVRACETFLHALIGP